MATQQKQINIVCHTADTMELSELTPFQNRLKNRTAKQIKQLADTIVDQGFTCPLFIWQDEDINKIIDGNSRYLALQDLATSGFVIPPIPVVLIDAVDEQEAKRKVLEVHNINGTITKDALLEYGKGLTIDFTALTIPGCDMRLDLPDYDSVVKNTDGKDYDSVRVQPTNVPVATDPPEHTDYRTVVCPHCDTFMKIRIHKG